jgi:CheY-like chemotaxis protein
MAGSGAKRRLEPPKSRLRVLVMDDNREVLATIGKMLRKLGCRVVAAASGEEAVEIFRKNRAEGASFDRIILDLTVPGGINGIETLKRMLEIDPAASAWISSGYFEGPVMAEYERHGFKGILKKPYTLQELSMTVLRD